MDQKKTGRFIAGRRKEKALSQAELGERLGVTNKTVSRWENGNYMPDVSLMQPLCRELGISVNELLSGECLGDESFRSTADAHLLDSLAEQKRLKRQRTLAGFLEGGGTGILVSALFSPDGLRKTITVLLAIAMVLAGWFCRRTLDPHTKAG